MANIALLGTCDTKLEELLFLRQQILDNGAARVILVDVGRTAVKHESITITQDKVREFSTEQIDLKNAPRGDIIKHMIDCATPCIEEQYHNGQIHGIISAGGSGGTSLASAVMRDALPVGFPKLIVSTVASGDTSPYIGETDITMMYSVVDIAGNNSLLEKIFANAAGAIAGMARAYHQYAQTATKQANARKRVGMTMFGVTTPCCDVARQCLETKYGCEVYVFHATGSGGRAMERLVREHALDAVLDITTTEICDHLMGGNMSAGPTRLEAAAAAGIPYVVSLGATSMVNFGGVDTVPAKFKKRLLYEHNPTVTLMRTSKEECQQVGEFLAEKLKSFSKDPQKVQVVLPLGGVCMISTPGAAFADADADEALFKAVRDGLQNSGIEIIDDQRDINDKEFAVSIAERLGELL